MLFKTVPLFFCLLGAAFAQSPTILGMTPDTALVGGGGFGFVVYGSGFQPGAMVYFKNTPLQTSFDPLGVNSFLPGQFLSAAGTGPITVHNPDGSVSNPYTFTIRTTTATPIFIGAAPTAQPPRIPALLFVIGTGIQPGVVLTWNGTRLNTGQLDYPFYDFVIPPSLAQTPGPVTLTLTNPGGSPSNALNLVVPPPRTMTSVSPSVVPAGSTNFTVTVNGSGFQPGDQIGVFNNGTGPTGTTQFVSSTELQAFITSVPPPATYKVVVVYTGSPAGEGIPFTPADQLGFSVAYASTNILSLTFGPPGCTYSLSSSGAVVGTAASAGSVQVITQPGCAWTATSPSGGVSVAQGGTGSGTASYSVQASGTARSVTLTVAGLPYTINQVPSCLFGLTPSSANVAAAGASGSFAVGVTNSSCTWTASSNASWLQVLSGASGTGNAAVNYAASPNPGSLGRTGTIVAGGQTFTVVQSGTAACVYSLLQASQAFGPGGGSGTVTIQTPAGCPWAAQSGVPWLTVGGSGGGSGDGTLSYSVAANPGTGTRSGSLTIAGLNFSVSQAGTSSALSCTANAPAPPQVAMEGRTELMGDVLLACTGLTGAVTADIALTLNTNVTNALTSGGATDAVLLVNEANPRNGQIASYGTIRWPGVSLVADSTGTATVRIANVRADTSLLTPASNLQSAAVTGLLNVESQTPVPVSNAQQIVASVIPTVAFAPPQIFPAGNLTRVTVAYSEASPTGFQSTTRLRLVMSNIPSNVSVFAPVSPSEGAGQAQLYSADASGAGGAPVAGSPFNGGIYQQLTVNNGVATATWVVQSAAPSLLETRTFVLFLQGASSTDASGIVITGGLGPASSVGVASATAPVPRYRDFSAAQKYVNLRVSTSVAKPPAGGPVRPLAPVVGGNVTFVTQVVNDDAVQTATNVTIRSSVPSGTALVSCSSSDGQKCGTGNGLASVNYGSLAPGGSVTVTTVVASSASLPDGSVVDNDAGVTSDDPNASLAGTLASTGVILVNGQPVVVGSLPASGAGSSQTFTFQFSHPAGYQSLAVVNVLINNFLDGRNACYLAYSNAGQTLYLVNDSGQAAGPFAGSVALGSTSTIQNSQCAVSLVSATGSGNTLTLVLNIAFTASFGGNKIAYVAARDQSASSDWQALGVWQVPGSATGSIAVAGVDPPRGAAPAGTNKQFKLTLTDSKGAGDFGVVDLLINNFIDGRKACYLAYVAATQTLVLVDDAGDAGGPYAGSMVLNGGNGRIENGQCVVDGSGSSVSPSANTLALTLNITFKSAFSGNRIFYAAGRDKADGNNTDWQAAGTWTVQ